MESELMNTQTTYVTLLESFERSMEKSFSNVDKDINNVEKSISNVNKDINSVEKSITTVGENMNGMDYHQSYFHNAQLHKQVTVSNPVHRC